MRDYIRLYNELEEEMSKEMLSLYRKHAKLRGCAPLLMGKDEKGNPQIWNSYDAVPVKIEMKLEGMFTKVNHILLVKNSTYSPNKILIKGFQVMRGRYRMREFGRLTIEEKQHILDALNEI